jgi:hypothetical protein
MMAMGVQALKKELADKQFVTGGWVGVGGAQQGCAFWVYPLPQPWPHPMAPTAAAPARPPGVVALLQDSSLGPLRLLRP